MADINTIGPPALNALTTSINANITELSRYPATDATNIDLVKQYTNLNITIKAVNDALAQYTIQSFSLKLTELNTQMAAIDANKQKYTDTFKVESKDVTLMGILKETWAEIKTNVVAVTTGLGMLFGCIIGSHWFFSSTTELSKGILYTLFYGLYGALLFPFTILYGIIFPPTWRAPLIPLFDKEGAPYWTAIPIISIFTGLFRYSTPQGEDDIDTHQTTLRLMCIIMTGLMGFTVYAKATGRV